ncbi:ScbR family autoregulator-binding transcription factor [Streptomyces sp. NPDC002004]
MTKQERAARTRDALIHSAAELFEQRGYVKSRLAEISSGAGVSAGALHFHFENKEAIAEAVEGAASAHLHRAARTVRDVGGPALQALTDTSHVFAHLLRRDTVVRAGFRLSGDATRTKRLDLYHDWHRCVRRMITDASHEGTLSRDSSQEKLTTAIVAATVGLETLGREDNEWLSRRSVAGLWQLLLPRVSTPQALKALDPTGSDAVLARFAALPTQGVARGPHRPTAARPLAVPRDRLRRR